MSLTNELSGAVEYFHRALSLRPEDTFSTTMLNEVNQLLSELLFKNIIYRCFWSYKIA